MFSVRTTFGYVSIMIADAFICSLIFWFTLSHIFWVPGWYANDGLLNHVSLDIITLIVVLSLGVARLYSYTEYYYPSDLLKQIATSFLISLGGIAILGYFAKGITSLDLGFIAPLVLTYILLYIFRYFLYFTVRDNRTRILIIGANDFAREIVEESMRKKFRSYEIVCIASSDEKKLGYDIYGIKVLPLKDKIEELIRDYSVDCIVVTKRNRRGMLPIHELLNCKTQNIRVQEGFSFYEKIKRKIIISEFLQPSWFIFQDGFSQNSIHQSFKRMIGIAVSIVLLAVLTPIILLVAIGIKLDSPGPVFYQQERVGRKGKVFGLLKFRSMREDAEALNGPMFAQKSDARITHELARFFAG